MASYLPCVGFLATIGTCLTPKKNDTDDEEWRMILTDNETSIDLLNNEAIAITIIDLLRERPDRPTAYGV